MSRVREGEDVSRCGRSWGGEVWRAAKWAGVVVCALMAGLWVVGLFAVALPRAGTPLKIPLWVPLLAAVILWLRWRVRKAEQVSR